MTNTNKYFRVPASFIESHILEPDFAAKVADADASRSSISGVCIPRKLLSLPRQQFRVACLIAARQFNRPDLTTTKALTATLGVAHERSVEKHLAALRAAGWLTRVDGHYVIRREQGIDDSAIEPVTVRGEAPALKTKTAALNRDVFAAKLRSLSAADFFSVVVIVGKIIGERQLQIFPIDDKTKEFKSIEKPEETLKKLDVYYV